MNPNADSFSTRREFLKNTGRIAAVSALAGVILPHVHAAENNTIQVALIGCGGRGSGAADNALSVQNGPIKLVAMADVFEDRMKTSHESLMTAHPNQVEVPPERRFIGFDAYKKAMDCLRPGDVAIFATPPAFRWVHFTYAIEKGINVFMEKPVTVDGPTSRRMFKLGEEAQKKNLKVGVGLMCRHCKARQGLFDHIKAGEIGDLVLLQAYRMHGAVAACFAERNTGEMSDLMYQIRNFHSFLWASGGLYSDFYIHNVDEACWMKDAWPVKAHALGGRHYRGAAVDQNFDTYSVEYTFADGTKFYMDGRTESGCREEHSTRAIGSKGSAIVSLSGHMPAKSATYKAYDCGRASKIWAFPQPEPNPYQVEWDDLIDAVRNNKPYNEVKRGVEASLATSMGRMAAHTGQVVTWDDILNSKHEFAPGVDKLTMSSAAPLLAGADGKYAIPQPGIIKDREF
ncbi:MAG: putative dehydrogenase [Pedosphaera sp.]|nr:putative dehydrogenase [Pedosphaera sp.]